MIHQKLTGSVHCRICAIDTPHSHAPDEIHRETQVRPVFEMMIYKELKQQSFSTWTELITHHGLGPISLIKPPEGDDVSPPPYPYSFGWNGLPPHLNNGGRPIYTVHHWAWRKDFYAPYKNLRIEELWSFFQASVKASSAIKPI